jgi:hypothetical protein
LPEFARVGIWTENASRPFIFGDINFGKDR